MIDNSNITRKRDLLPPNDAEYGTHERRKKTIVGKAIEIGATHVCDDLYGATFVDCDVRFKCSGQHTRLSVMTATFQDCLISAKKKQIIPTWEANFERCVFRGNYSLRFGGTVVDCDFSKARLIYAQFLQTSSLGAVVWPGWPHVGRRFPSRPISISFWLTMSAQHAFSTCRMRSTIPRHSGM